MIRERLFREGERVETGQPLFQIDPRPPLPRSAGQRRGEATHAKAVAALSPGHGQTVTAPLVSQNAASRLDFETAVATQKQAQARSPSPRLRPKQPRST
ncbi:MAG: Membrane fusion protein multidrug efflux system [Roseomonas sp.]|nr:Membrane fusion protein multidrug efflux system [Roseomonas sp.]